MPIKKSFSIIIPTLNEEKAIAKTLGWLTKQDYDGKFEIIVVDAGSKDKTVKIAKKFADKVFLTKRGTAYQRNFGAKMAKYGTLLFLDADTLLMPNALSEFSKCFIDNVVAVVPKIMPTKMSDKLILLYSAYNLNMEISIKIKKPHISGACVAYLKKAFFRAGGFDENYRMFEDLRLSEKIIKLGKIKLTEDTAVFTSGRKMEKWGFLKSARNYLDAYLKYLFKRKLSPIKDYDTIR